MGFSGGSESGIEMEGLIEGQFWPPPDGWVEPSLSS